MNLLPAAPERPASCGKATSNYRLTQHQVIYSTHSPFMIDWDFPQRIRMLVRDSKQ